MHATHDSPPIGHKGFVKNYGHIREIFTWNNIKEGVLKCHTCQHNKVHHTHHAGIENPFPIPKKKWESMSMEFIIGLPKVQGRGCIYVVVENLMKLSHFFIIPFGYTR